MYEESLELSDGIITRLAAQKKKPDRVSVFLDGSFAFGLQSDLIFEFGLSKGKHLTVEDQRTMIRRDQLSKALKTAIHYLSYRARTVEEVRKRLDKGGYDTETAEDVVRRLEALGYLDDADFALNYARHRFETGGYGPFSIKKDLMEHGVHLHIIDELFQTLFVDEEQILERARQVAEKRWKQLGRETDPVKKKKKLFDYLVRRGFSYDVIRIVYLQLITEEN